MLNFLKSHPRLFWGFIAFSCFALEGAALFYQYYLDYGPCVLCIHIRAILAGLMVFALIAMAFGKTDLFGGLVGVGLTGAFLMKAYDVLAVERLWAEGTCTMDAGFPSFMPLDQWLPSVFEPWEACGYTPVIFAGITMAEILVAIAACSVALMVMFLLSAILGKDLNAGEVDHD